MGIRDTLAGIIATKESRSNPALAALDVGQPKWTPDRYKLLAEAGVMRNLWAGRCIRLIAASAAGTEWAVYERQSDGKRVELEPIPRSLTTPGIGNLLRIIHQQANDEGMTWGRYLEESFAYWHASGNHFTEVVALGADRPEDPPVWLYPQVPDDTLRIIPGAAHLVQGYVLEASGGKVPFEPHQMMHGRFWHPTDRYYGLSPVRAAIAAIDGHNSARAWNVAMLQNDARPAGFLVGEGIDEPEQKRLEEKLDKRWGQGSRGGRRIRRPMILSGGLKWIGLGMTPAEMDWLEGMKHSAGEITMSFGVAIELVGPSDMKRFATYPEARKAFWEDTMLPLLDRFRDDVNANLTARYGDQYEVDYKRHRIAALQEDSDKRSTRIVSEFAANVRARDEAREALDLPPVDGGALVFAADLQRSLLPSPTLDPAIGKALEVLSKSAVLLDRPNDQVDVAAVRRLLEAPRVIDGKAIDLTSEEAKAAFYLEQVEQRNTVEAKVAARAESAFDEQRRLVIAAIENAPGIDSVLGAAAKAVSVEAFAPVYALAWKATMDRFGLRVLAGLKGTHRHVLERKAVDEDAVIDLFTNAAEAYAEQIVPARIAGVTETTRTAVTSAVTTGIREGQTIPEIAKAVDDAFGGMAGNRAMTIARTEVLGASGAGGQIMAQSTGLPLAKEWIAARDSRTRQITRGDDFDHALCDGQKVALDEPFAVPGRQGPEALQFPGDPRGSAENIINCRCTNGYIPLD